MHVLYLISRICLELLVIAAIVDLVSTNANTVSGLLSQDKKGPAIVALVLAVSLMGALIARLYFIGPRL